MKTMNTLAKFGAGTLGALAITSGAVGVAGAQDTDAPSDETTESVEDRRAERRDAFKTGLADVLGITKEELQSARESGQSLAEIAADDVDAVAEYLTDRIEARIDARVESGRLTAEVAAERLADVEERVAERIEDTELRTREGRRGHHRGGAPAPATVDS